MKPDETLENLAEIDVAARTVQPPDQAAFLRASALAARIHAGLEQGRDGVA
jgi:hypothetical protein